MSKARSRANGCRTLYKHLKPVTKRKSRLGYSKRQDTLVDLGYDRYAEYLASDIWKVIRSKKLNESPYCLVCARKATQVHHFCYLDVVLAGCADDMLISVCEDCHVEIEFDGDQKRNLTSAQYFLVGKLNITGRSAVADRIMGSYRKLKRQHKNRVARQKRAAPSRQDLKYLRKQEGR
jgi:hypothetical protein